MQHIAHDLNFWSEIMRDHAEFQLMTLSSRETQYAMTSQRFKELFEHIGNEAKKLMQNPNQEEEVNLVRKTIPILIDYINYKTHLLKKLLECDIELGLHPTFINHMINEAMEFHRNISLSRLDTPVNKVMENIHLHMIWLPDAAGHSAAISDELDATEFLLIDKANKFEKRFNELFIKATELEKMLPRTGLENGALEYLNEEVIVSINEFIEFSDDIRRLREKCKAMGTLDPLLPDHMIREEKYYLTNIMRLME